MTKKILSLMIIITFLCTSVFGQAIFANNESVTDEIEVSKFDIAQVDAEKVAAVFLLSDFVNNPSSKWDSDCKIGDITPLYDFDNNITAYSCQVVNGSIDSGYIVVSTSSDLNIYTATIAFSETEEYLCIVGIMLFTVYFSCFIR